MEINQTGGSYELEMVLVLSFFHIILCNGMTHIRKGGNMRTIKEIRENPKNMKVLKWFGSFTFILVMYAMLSDFGLLAALVLIYVFIT